MEVICSTNELLKKLISKIDINSNKVFIILIGGCSRSGKTTLSEKLYDNLKINGINSLLVSIDSWLLSIEERKPDSTVSDRYEINSIVNAVQKLKEGKSVEMPKYDLISRRRRNESSRVFIESGVLIVEGTITLSITKLLNMSDFNIYVQISDYERVKKLINFYSNIKKIDKLEYKKIIKERENEEVPFIKNSSKKADIIFLNK